MLGIVGLAVAGCGSGDEDGDGVRTDAGRSLELTYAVEGELDDDARVELERILEQRLADLGVGDASAEVDGDRVEIDVDDPGDVDPGEVEDVVQLRAELTFRPVLAELPGGATGSSAAAPPTSEDPPPTETVPDAAGERGYQLGPAEVTGDVIEDARAETGPDGRWSIALVMTQDGIVRFNETASRCAPPSAPCPTGQLAIVLDGVVHSAPVIQEPRFERDQITISGDFSEEEAKDLALVLRYGALPAALTLVASSGP